MTSRMNHLVALHRGFDGLILGSVEGRQGIGVD
jgi:hypothetical protein